MNDDAGSWLWAFQVVLAIMAFVLITIMPFSLVRAARRANQIRRDAGDLLAPPFDQPVSKLLPLIYLFCFVLLLLATIASVVAGETVAASSVLTMVIVGAQMLYLQSFEWLGLRGIELRERGLVLSGAIFVPWADVKRIKWSEGDPTRLMLAFRGRVCDMPVAHNHRESLDEFFAENVGMAN